MKGAEVSITVQSGRTARHDDLQALREALQRAAPSQQQHLDLRSRLIDIVLQQSNYMELAAVHIVFRMCHNTSFFKGFLWAAPGDPRSVAESPPRQPGVRLLIQAMQSPRSKPQEHPRKLSKECCREPCSEHRR